MRKKLVFLCLILVMAFTVCLTACSCGGDVPTGVINSVAELKNINFNGEYVLGADLDLTGWTPLGSPEKPFKGTLDGNGYKITNLSYNIGDLTVKTDDCFYGGIFAINRGTVKNIVIQNLSVSGDNSKYNGNIDKYYIGGVVGNNKGTVKDCSVSGSVDIKAEDAKDPAKIRAGMISGRSDGTIEGCSASGSLSVTAQAGTNRTGGVCGMNSGGTVSNCSAAVTVTAKTIADGNPSAGGLIGYCDESGSIQKSYATGNVTSESVSGTAYAGGLIGYVDATDDTTEWNYTVENCYASGNIYAKSTSKNAYAGGLIARIENALLSTETYVNNCYAIGDVEAKAVISSIDINCYAAGLVGRIQIEEGIATINPTISLENCFVAASSIKSSDKAGRIRGSGKGTLSSCYYIEIQLVGLDTNISGISATKANLQTASWLTANLGWSGDIWTFTDGSYPKLK